MEGNRRRTGGTRRAGLSETYAVPSIQSSITPGTKQKGIIHHQCLTSKDSQRSVRYRRLVFLKVQLPTAKRQAHKSLTRGTERCASQIVLDDDRRLPLCTGADATHPSEIVLVLLTCMPRHRSTPQLNVSMKAGAIMISTVNAVARRPRHVNSTPADILENHFVCTATWFFLFNGKQADAELPTLDGADTELRFVVDKNK